MKKLITLAAALLVASLCSAQSLDEIVNNYYAANGIEVLEKAQTIVVEGTISQMGMDLPIAIQVKKPDKVRVTQEFSGLEIVLAFDGEKGYMINPLTGDYSAVELPQDQLSGIAEYNLLNDALMRAYSAGKLSLEGEGSVEDQPAYKLLISDDNGNDQVMFIDKESHRLVKTVTTVNQMGQEMEVETLVRQWLVVDGITFGTETAQFVNGAELGGMVISTIELDKPIDDSMFKL